MPPKVYTAAKNANDVWELFKAVGEPPVNEWVGEFGDGDDAETYAEKGAELFNAHPPT